MKGHAARYPSQFPVAFALVLAVVTAIGVLPFVIMGYYALTDLSFSIPGRNGAFVGLENFVRASGDERFLHSLLLTLRFTAVAVPIEILGGLVVALVAYRAAWVRRWFAPVTAVPVMLSGIAAGLLWRLLLNGDYGAATYLLRVSGITQVSALSSGSGAFGALVAVDIWQWAPFCALVLLAARSGLPEAPYLAARIDGASSLQTTRDITLPGLRGALLICVLFRATDCVREFDKAIVLTNGGPGRSTELLSLYLWNRSFVDGDLGYGAALTVVVYVVVLTATIAVLAKSERLA